MGKKSDYGFYLTSNVLDGAGGFFASILIQLILVNQLGFDGLQLGILNAIPVALTILLSVVAGSLVDRLPVLMVLFVSIGINSLLIFTFAALLFFGGLNFLTVLLIGALMALAGIFSQNAQLVAATILQQTHKDSSLVARVTSADQATRILAPLFAIPVVARNMHDIGLAGAAMLVGIAAFLLIPLSSTFRAIEPTVDSPETDEQPASKLAGFRILREDRTLWGAVLLIVITNFGLAIGDLASTLLLLRELRLSEGAFVTVQMIESISGLAVSLVMTFLLNRFRSKTLLLFSSVCQLMCIGTYIYLAMVDQASLLWVAIPGSLWSIAIVVLRVVAMDHIAKGVPSNKAGVAFGALRSISMAVVPIGALTTGVMLKYTDNVVSLGMWLLVALIGLFVTIFRISSKE